MTKAELAQAQAFKIAYDMAERHADERDPKRLRRDAVSRCFDSMGRAAADGFIALTGRLIHEVTVYELNTERPAVWTRGVGGKW